MRRAPIRVRVTLAFAAAMVALFAALAIVIVVRVTHQLDVTIDEGLRARAGDIAAAPSGRPLLHGSDARFTEIRVGGTPYGPRTITRRLEGEPTRIRELAIRSGPRLVVVGQNLEARDEAVSGLKSQLALGLPLGLVLVCLAGYLATAGALRPVQAMTRRAREISAGDADAQLPVPDTRDEIADLGTTLNEMLSRLHEGLERERAFVADASHELRTPLTTIGVELDVALRTAVTEHEYRTALESAVHENRRIAALAEDLLVLARADQGRLPMRPEPTDIGVLVRAAGERIKVRATAQRIEILVTADDDLFAVADELRLGQLLDNLTDNALRYAHTRVTLLALRSDADLLVYVSDDGCGFPAEFMPRAFDRFSVADTARAGAHAGLGLAIVAAITKAHGWRVEILRPSTVEIRMTALEPDLGAR